MKIPIDKAKHFAVGFAIALVVRVVTDAPGPGLALAVGAGFGKERWDAYQNKKLAERGEPPKYFVEKADIAWTAAGGAAGEVVGGWLRAPLLAILN